MWELLMHLAMLHKELDKKFVLYFYFLFFNLLLQTHTVISRLRLHMLQNHGNSIFTTLCRFQLFGEEEKISIS
jgi:hypothetical protein